MCIKKAEGSRKPQLKTKTPRSFYCRVLATFIVISAAIFIISAILNFVIAPEAPSIIKFNSQEQQHGTPEHIAKQEKLPLHMFGSSFMNLFDKVSKYAALKQADERSRRSLSQIKHNKYLLKAINRQRELGKKRAKMGVVLHREVSLKRILQRLGRQKRDLVSPEFQDVSEQCGRDKRRAFEQLQAEYKQCKASSDKKSCLDLYSKMYEIAKEFNAKLLEMKVWLEKNDLMPTSGKEDNQTISRDQESMASSTISVVGEIQPVEPDLENLTTSKIDLTTITVKTTTEIVSTEIESAERMASNESLVTTEGFENTTEYVEIVNRNDEGSELDTSSTTSSTDTLEKSFKDSEIMANTTSEPKYIESTSILTTELKTDEDLNEIVNSTTESTSTISHSQKLMTTESIPSSTVTSSTLKQLATEFRESSTPLIPDSDENKVEFKEDIKFLSFSSDRHHQVHEDLPGEFNPLKKWFPSADVLESSVPLKYQLREKIKVEDLTRNSELIDANEPVLESPYLGHQHLSENPQAVGASGPFMSLCEQLTKQATPLSGKVTAPPHNNGFTNNPSTHFTSHGGQSSFPVTGETMKASAQVIYNPNFGMMQMPTCFIPAGGAAGNIRAQGHQFNMQPMHMGLNNAGGMYPISQGGYIYIPPSAPSLQSGLNMGQFAVPISGTGVISQANQHLPRNLMQSQPVFCSYMPGSVVLSGTGMMHGNFAQPSFRSASKDPKEETKDDFDIEEFDNIPTGSDIVYSTYVHHMFPLRNISERNALKNCPEGTMACIGTSQCIEREKWCDSNVDCTDSSDEMTCTCKSRLSRAKICDGYPDCPMGEDELGCFGCDKFQFTCYNDAEEFAKARNSTLSMCFSVKEKCDGSAQCLNLNDERDCSMIVGSLGNYLSYSTSYTQGILHRNYMGKWYPVCDHGMKWAREACEAEVGPLDSDPIISVIPGNIPGQFIQPKPSHHNLADIEPPIILDSCPPGVQSQISVIIHVKCPEVPCGTTKKKDPSAQIMKVRRSLASHEKLERKKRTDERVVGGKPCDPLQYPFVVAMYKDGRFHCGGIIYNEHWIITAAHCLVDFQKHYYEVRVGMLRRYSYSPMIQNLKVSHAIIHEEYERRTMKNDVALLRTAEPIRFNRWVRPICMPDKGRSTMDEEWIWGPTAGTLCTAVGWGAIMESGPDPDQLRQVQVPVLSQCKHKADQEGAEICAGDREGGRDACQGDSGGPLFCKSITNPKEWYLAGIVSHGMGCARAGEPGVYTRVALYLDWIDSNVNAESLPLELPKQTCPGYTCVWGGELCISKRSQCNRIIDCLGGEDEAECGLMNLQQALEPNTELVGETEASTTPLPSNNTTQKMGTTTASSIDFNQPMNDQPPNHKDEKQSNNATNTEETKVPQVPMEGPKKINLRKFSGKKFICKKIAQSINEGHRCDRITDCEDGSDEENCTCKEYLQGVLDELICDGKVDCSDLTDEVDCAFEGPSEGRCVSNFHTVNPLFPGNCTTAEFLCPLSRICINKANRCDDKIDCPFKEDELDCFAITDGRTVFLDSTFRPSLQTVGIFTRNQKGDWRVVCDDEVDFTTQGAKTAGEVCTLLGFRGYNFFNTTTVTKHGPISSMRGESRPSSRRVRRFINKHLTEPYAYSAFFDTTEQVDSRTKKEAPSDFFERTPAIGTEDISLSNDKCTALFVECVPYTNAKLHPTQLDLVIPQSSHPDSEPAPSSVQNSTLSVDPPEVSKLPWAANIYIDGRLACFGALLDSNWVAVAASCVNQLRWETDYVAAHFGGIKADQHHHHKPKGPFEQIRRIDCIQDIEGTETTLVHLEQPVHFNRHILPTFLPNKIETEALMKSNTTSTTYNSSSNHPTKNNFDCVATALDDSGKAYLSFVRKVPDHPECKDGGHVCFQRFKGTGPKTPGCTEKDINATLRGLIACKEKDTGWYPRAFFTTSSSECDFKDTLTVQTLENSNANIQQVLEHPYCRYPYSAPHCSTLRCPLGECLQHKQICNGKVDCHEDPIDENPEMCHVRERGCHISEMKCGNGNCISKRKFCDHINDCGDFSDEPSVCSCLTYLRATEPQRICDGVRNCWDKSDENPQICNCTGETFTCGSSNLCVPFDFVCDLEKDCPHGEDELYCYGLEQPLHQHSFDSDGFSQVLHRSYGVWHTKCFARSNPPNETDVMDICHKMGFNSGIKDKAQPRYRLLGLSENNELSGRDGNTTITMATDSVYGRAMKAVLVNKFTPLKLNEAMMVYMKVSRPIAERVPWNEDDSKKCLRMEVKCE